MKFIIALSLIVLSGCSAVIARTGIEGTDLSRIRVGAARMDVEFVLGPPVSSVTDPDGTVRYSYGYRAEFPPDKERAGTNAALAVVSLGLSELITTPLEVAKARTRTLKIVYGEDSRVVSVSGFPKDPAQVIDGAIREYHRNINQVRLGVSQSEVRKKIGDPRPAGHIWPSERARLPDGSEFTILYYRVTHIPDDRITKDELAPFLFINDILKAIGWVAVTATAESFEGAEQQKVEQVTGTGFLLAAGLISLRRDT